VPVEWRVLWPALSVNVRALVCCGGAKRGAKRKQNVVEMATFADKRRVNGADDVLNDDNDDVAVVDLENTPLVCLF